MNMHREYATLWEPMNPICSFSWCLFLFLSLCLSVFLAFFSTGRINLVFDEFVSVSIYGLQSANWFIHSHRDGEKGKERYGESMRSIQQQMYQRKWVCSKMTQLCLSRSWVAVRFFFAIALFALCWWSVVLSHSLSLFADFLSFTPRTFTDGLLHSLFDHLLFLVLCFLLNSYSFFLSPFHTYTNEHIQKKMMLMVMIHSNAYDHIVQKSQ